ncbi:rhomboid family intramembrane serine protease [Halostagnicola bangensis]
MDPIGVVLGLILAATIIVSIVAIRWVHEPERRWRDVLRSRFVLGVPWGTVIVLAFVLAVYLFVQDGISDFSDPVSIPYRAWSYYYPLGMASASFTHASSGHLLSNFFGALVVAPIAEYAWGHYPNGRDEYSNDRNKHPNWREERSMASMWTNPRIRAFVIFPLAVVAIGLVTSLFALGPVIGFSGIVFAFAGFAIVRYPIHTIVAILGGQTILLTTYRALLTPVGVYIAEPSPAMAPSWANVAIQGHALGFFIGFILGAILLHRRNYRPNALRLWIAILIFGFAQGLWQIYWFGDQNIYYLFQGPGIAIVTALALVVTLAVTASERPLVPTRVREGFTRSSTASREIRTNATIDRILEIGASSRDKTRDNLERVDAINRGSYPRDSGAFSALSGRQAAFLVIILVVAAISGPALPVNLFVISGETETADNSITVEDYTIEYVEGEENELVGVIDIGAFGQDTTVESNGVIVSSEERHIWQETVTAHQLEFSGEETVSVGGPGWRETVHVERTGWVPTGNDPVYQIWLSESDAEKQLAFTADESMADVQIDDRTVTIGTENEEFVLEVELTNDDGETVKSTAVAVPDDSETTQADGIEFVLEDGGIYAIADGTIVQVAEKEEYNEIN